LLKKLQKILGVSFSLHPVYMCVCMLVS